VCVYSIAYVNMSACVLCMQNGRVCYCVKSRGRVFVRMLPVYKQHVLETITRACHSTQATAGLGN